MAPTTGGSSSLLTPDEEAMALLQSGPLSPDVYVPSDGEVDDDDGCSSSASTESTGKLKSDDEIDDDDDEIDEEIDDEPEPGSGGRRGPLRLRVKCSGSNLLRPPPTSETSTSTSHIKCSVSTCERT